MLECFSALFERPDILIENEDGRCFAYIGWPCVHPSHIIIHQSSFLEGFPRLSCEYLKEYEKGHFPKIVIAPGIADKARALGLLTTAEVYTMSERVYNDPTISVITMKDLIRESEWPSPKEAVAEKLKLYIEQKVR